MSPWLRAVAVVAFAILAGIGYRLWKAPREIELEVSPLAEIPVLVPDQPVAPAIVVAPESAGELITVAQVDTLDPARRLAGLALSVELRRPGVNTVAEALAYLRTMDQADRAEYFQSLLSFCLENDREGTADLIVTMDDEKWRDFGLGFVLVQWSGSDPIAALRWAAEHPRGENDHGRYHAAYEGFAAKHPVEALRALQRDELSGDRDALSRVVMFHFAEQGRLAEARAWIEKLPEGNLRELLVRQTVHFWAEKAPADAAQWLAATASDETFRAGMGTLVHTLVVDDPRFAAGLTQQFKDPEIRESHLADVIYLWAKRDLGSAAAWLREQPPGPQLDPAIARLIETIAPNDPVEARQWANAISDPKMRQEMLTRLASAKRG
ncbi:MAG TPA: hypothetical protein VHO24_07705 [Opitutaceae bacterium]|nr:hypothetical protein [Opitutaceae bacterium]